MLKHGAENETTMDVLVRAEYEKQVMAFSCKEFCSCLFIWRLDNARYTGLTQQQSNTFLMEDEKYTKTMVTAMTLLEDWQGGASKQNSGRRAS